MARHLTGEEIHILEPVFKDTLKYHSISCTINKLNIGGVGNSITPAGIPYFSKLIYCADFSKAGDADQWVFVHEMMHVWQWQHGTYVVNEAIGVAITHRDYATAYPYDLVSGKKLTDYNIEQQAAIVADYWWLDATQAPPRYNNNKRAAKGDYSELIDQLQKSGRPTPEMNRIPI